MFSLNIYLTARFEQQNILFRARVLFNIARLYGCEADHHGCGIDQSANWESIVQQSVEYKQLEEYSVQGETRDGAPRREAESSSVPVFSYLISRSRDREVALTVPYVHSNRTLFLAKKPQVSWPWCICVRARARVCCISLGIYARVYADTQTRV